VTFTARAATLCGLQRKLDEYSELERQIRAIDLTDASPQTRRHHAQQLERAAEGKREAIREMDALTALVVGTRWAVSLGAGQTVRPSA
jgi:hypothetical protein